MPSENTGRAAMTAQGWLLSALFASLSASCIPEKSCEFTRTCSPPAGKPDAAALTSSSSSSAEAVTLDAAVSDARVSDETATSSAVDDGGNPVVTCLRSTDCSGDLRYCDDVALVCTACRGNADCKDAAAPYCAVSPGAVQDNHCVECLPESNTCDGVCVDNRCAACDVVSHAGCSEQTPLCSSVDGVATCVACRTNDDCANAPDAPVCDDFVCKACSPENPDSCPAETPVCVEEGDSARCVECAAPEHCADFSGSSGAPALCVQERCTTCTLGNNDGCPTDAPFCVALVPEQGDAGVVYLAPPQSAEEATEQYLDYEHTCVECIEGACGGSLPGCFEGACVPCTENAHCAASPDASLCDLETHTCVGCQAAGDCSHLPATPACDIERRLCVQCTAAEDTCGEKACQTVPGAAQYTCSMDTKERTAPCFPCVSDSACQPNSHCVQDTFEEQDLGWFCFRKEAALPGGDECADTQVFVDRFNGTSVDGVDGPYCRPRLTSCQGYLHYEEGPVPGDNQQPTCTADEDCGAPGVDDGYCVYFTMNSNRCTYACLSPIDCETDVPCPEVTSVSGSTNKVCQVNP